MPRKTKEEIKKYRKEYHAKNREKLVQQMRVYYDEHRKESSEARRKWRLENLEHTREYHRKYDAEYRKNNPDKFKKSITKWSNKNIEKVRCHWKLNWNIRNGNIVKPELCVACGIKSKLHGHHSDYTKPLEVEWLCPICHKQKHKEALC